MKKTLLFTIIMLAVSACTLSVFAGQKEKDWEEPNTDSIELTSTSPVEQVNEELEKIGSFAYIVVNEWAGRVNDLNVTAGLLGLQIETDENMISMAEAAYYGGSTLEKMFPDETFADKEFVMTPIKWKSPHADTRTVYEGTYHIYNPADAKINPYGTVLAYTYFVDAYTGEVIYVCVYDFEKKTPVNKNMTEQEALAYATNMANALGYDNFSKYYIMTTKYNDEIDANFFEVDLVI
ncbi:MAG: hypothetical protein IIV99_02330, partial [Oscillospiraceae bacterium]|nr:hypothetical protein [Oscillospiraceae bacterium]